MLLSLLLLFLFCLLPGVALDAVGELLVLVLVLVVLRRLVPRLVPSVLVYPEQGIVDGYPPHLGQLGRVTKAQDGP